jgi:hypothetical protein
MVELIADLPKIDSCYTSIKQDLTELLQLVRCQLLQKLIVIINQ